MNRIRMIHRDTLSCEPILRRMPNGELLCVTQCGGLKEPAPENRVIAFHSSDNGETWNKTVSVFPENGEAVYCTEVMVLNDEISAFLTVHNGVFLGWHNTVMKSRDSGYTWEEMGPPPFFEKFTFMRGMLRLKNGDVLIPYQHYPIDDKEHLRLLVEPGNRVRDAEVDYVESGVIISRDGGKTFTRCGRPVHFDIKGTWAWSEPTLAELADGTLVMILRRDRTGFLWRSESLDGGVTWSEAVQTDIPNPNNKPKLVPLPDDRFALLHTPNSAKRFPLQVWISEDGMKTWPYRETVTDFPGSYDYSDGFYEDGHIYFTIEHNRQNVLFIDHTINMNLR